MSEADPLFAEQAGANPIAVLVVGLGQAGSRFVRACLAINAQAPRLRIVAGVDADAGKCAAFEAALDIPCHTSIDAAARTVAPDLAIVTVPDHQHCRTLLDLRRRFPTLRRILCEKPLAATAAEAQLLARTFDRRDLSLNFVERFSPIVASLRRFMQQHGRRVVRANCMWGKYRIKDARPTLGVILVELAHPLDLALMVAQVRPGTRHRIASVVATRSNFDTADPSLLPLDTVHVALEFAHGVQVLISSSLLWPKRERRIEFLLADESGTATELAVLVFDNPRWDIDRLEIHDIRARGGQPTTLHTEDVGADAWPVSHRTIGKVCRFVSANLAELNGQADPLLARLDQGVYVQELMEDISRAAYRQAMPLTCFADPVTVQQPDMAERLASLSQLASGTVPDTAALMWDLPY